MLSVYRGGVEIGRSSLIYGADNKPTPLGTFPILEKDADHHSNLYDAPMPHMLRLTWDGVALHGSPTLEEALATRGCVGLPVQFAELLFSAVRRRRPGGDLGRRHLGLRGRPRTRRSFRASPARPYATIRGTTVLDSG